MSTGQARPQSPHSTQRPARCMARTMWYSRLPRAWLGTGTHWGRLQSMVQCSQ